MDVVGYSALMERAEEATYAEFERLKRELVEPSLSRHEGRLIKTTGDGAHAEFASPLAAIRCAVEIQDHLATGGSPLRLRVGLNLGDVIVAPDDDLYGDGINIAVRLEGLADPGGILISEKVYNEVEGKLDVCFEDRGERPLKNISRPVRAYAVRSGTYSALTERLSAAPPPLDKPSVAVLPFENMSGEPEQEYFAAPACAWCWHFRPRSLPRTALHVIAVIIALALFRAADMAFDSVAGSKPEATDLRGCPEPGRPAATLWDGDDGPY